MYLVIRKNSIILTLFICFITVFSIFCINKATLMAKSDNTNWGLSFKKTGETPVGNASPEFLKNYNSYYIGDTNQKNIYLTFDCGYENGYMPKILEILKKHDIKATFFVVGSYIKTNPELVKQMVADGHIVGNHTMNHPNMSKMSTLDEFKNEIEQVEKLFKECTGQEFKKYYRPPQGIYSTKNLEMAKELGYKTIFWSLAYVDWKQDSQPDTKTALEKIKSRIHNGAIILLHSTSKTNADILDTLITDLKSSGYTFKNLDELAK